MKTHLPILLLLLTFQLYTAFSTPVAPLRVLTVTPTASAMVMDGNDDEIGYTAEQTTDIFNATGLTGGDADFKADIKLCWDWNYLYLWANVSDDTEEDYNWGVGNPWEFDNVEVFLQLDTNTVITAYDGHTVQLRICRGLDSVETAGRAPRDTYHYFVANTSSGWVTETAIPWTCVLSTGEGPQLPEEYVNIEIGFDFAGADSDNSDSDPEVGNRDVQSAWDNDDSNYPEDRTEDNAWNNTSVFGRIILGCCPPPPQVSDESEGLTPGGIGLFPNPAGDRITVKNLPNGNKITIYDMLGVKMMELESVTNETVIDIAGLKNGLYTLVINRSETVRFVKE